MHCFCLLSVSTGGIEESASVMLKSIVAEMRSVLRMRPLELKDCSFEWTAFQRSPVSFKRKTIPST